MTPTDQTTRLQVAAMRDDLIELLSEAAVEIRNLDDKANPVYQRIRLALKMLEAEVGT